MERRKLPKADVSKGDAGLDDTSKEKKKKKDLDHRPFIENI